MNCQKVIKEMHPNETVEHHRDHRCRNKEVNQFCYDSISKYRGFFCGCITRHHPVWAGSRSRVSRHLSLHLSIRGDEVRVRSCRILRYRILPKKKQCILEKHRNLQQKYNSCRLLLPITHKYLSSHETRKHRHIFARVAAFWQRVFQTLPNLDVHPGVAIYHTLKIFSNVNAKDLLMPHTKFQVCTLKIMPYFATAKKIPLLLNRSVQRQSLKGAMFVYSVTQTFLLLSKLFDHTICFKWDLCRECNKWSKTVKLVLCNTWIKPITWYSVIFRHNVHYNASNLDSSFSINCFVQSNHSIFKDSHIARFGCFSYGCLWSKQCFFHVYAPY